VRRRVAQPWPRVGAYLLQLLLLLYLLLLLLLLLLLTLLVGMCRWRACVTQLPDYLTDAGELAGYAHRVGELLEYLTQERDRVLQDEPQLPPNVVVSRSQPCEVVVADVAIDSPDGKRLLSHVSLHVRAGGRPQSILIMGRSGAGKSTLLRSVCVAGEGLARGSVSRPPSLSEWMHGGSGRSASVSDGDGRVSECGAAAVGLADANGSGYVQLAPMHSVMHDAVTDADADACVDVPASGLQPFVMFLPQRPYMFEGTLRSLLVYPSTAPSSASSDAALLRWLHALDLDSLTSETGVMHALWCCARSAGRKWRWRWRWRAQMRDRMRARLWTRAASGRAC
jgi:hypothetical protein